MSHPEGVFLDKGSQPSVLSALLAFVTGTAALTLAFVLGIATWYGIVLAVFGTVLAAAGVLIFLGTRHPEWHQRTLLTSRGLVESRAGGQTEIVPVEAIEAVGLSTKNEVTQMVLWYDPAAAPPLSRSRRIAEMAPGKLRLNVCDLEYERMHLGYLGLRDIREVREFVEANALGEWRHERL
jgi:hypothetical protein